MRRAYNFRYSRFAEGTAHCRAVGIQAPYLCRKNVYFTAKLTAEPATTFAPGDGSCETMMEAAEGLAGISGPGALSAPGAGAFSGDGGKAAMVTCPIEKPAS